LGEAAGDPSWAGLAALDAGARMVRSVVDAGGWRRGSAAARLAGALFERARVDAEGGGDLPDAYWSVRPVPAGAAGEPQLLFRGAVLVRVRGGREGSAAPEAALPPELAAALAEPPPRPGRELLRLLWEGSRPAPAALWSAIPAASLGVVFEALLFRSFFDLGRPLGLADARLAALSLLAAFAAGLLLLDLPIGLGTLALGRHLETRLR